MGALAHGLPLVLLPLGADQPANAQAAEAAGVALVLDPARMTPVDVRDAVRAVLMQRDYRHHARRLQTEIMALPEFDQGVRLLERLARTKTPPAHRFGEGVCSYRDATARLCEKSEC